jgi:ribosomal protein S13
VGSYISLAVIFIFILVGLLWLWLSREELRGSRSVVGVTLGDDARGGDDLTRIKGVGPVIARKLNALGITTYRQIADFSAEDMARVDEVLDFKGRIEREGWIRQARQLKDEK